MGNKDKASWDIGETRAKGREKRCLVGKNIDISESRRGALIGTESKRGTSSGRGSRSGGRKRAFLSLFIILFLWIYSALTEPPLFLLASFCALSLHELSHAAMAYITGGGVKGIAASFPGLTLSVSGGRGYPSMLLVYLAGPAANLLTLLLSFAPQLSPDNEFFFYLYISSLFFGVFNLLPLPDFDGEGIMKCVFSMLMPLGRSDKAAEAVTLLFSALFCFFAIALELSGGRGIYPILLSIYVFARLQTKDESPCG